VTLAPITVEVERNGRVESEHLVDVAVVDAGGNLVAAAGDAERRAAFRSSAKPLQAAAAREAGWVPGDERGLAIACASHNGEPGHLDAVCAVLSSAGLGEDALRCPRAWPLRRTSAWTGGETRVAHNCSGKHAAMLAACAAAGWPLESYRDPGHPLQRAILARLQRLTSLPTLPVLVDGCGVPTILAPLSALARAFASVAGSAEAAAMKARPFLVGGTDRFDTALLSETVVTKGGAEGLSCTVVEGGPTVVAKSRDGAARPLGPAVIACLEQVDPTLVSSSRLDPFRNPPVLGGGEPVGALRARGAPTWL